MRQADKPEDAFPPTEISKSRVSQRLIKAYALNENSSSSLFPLTNSFSTTSCFKRRARMAASSSTTEEQTLCGRVFGFEGKGLDHFCNYASHKAVIFTLHSFFNHSGRRDTDPNLGQFQFL